MSPEPLYSGRPDQNRLQENKNIYEGLHVGLRDRENIVSWRTLIADLRQILGSPVPKDFPAPITSFEKGRVMVEELTAGTFMYPLKEEILWSIFGSKNEGLILPWKEDINPIDALLINVRHKSDPLLWTLADYLKAQGKTVAVLNPVGHYGDDQERVVEFPLLIHPVKKAVFLGSTQKREGGDFELLTEVVRTILRNPNSVYMIDSVDIDVPFWGGSRSHVPGQDPELGYENMQVIHQSKMLTLMLNDIKVCIRENPRVDPRRHVIEMKEGRLVFPPVRIFSSDIHNEDFPRNKIRDGGYEFISISPAREQVEECQKILIEEKKENLPRRLISCDEGSDKRTEDFARETLLKTGGKVQIICIDKERSEAGKIKKVEIRQVFECSLDESGRLIKTAIEVNEKYLKEEHVLIYVDDMIDTGGTATDEMILLRKLFKKSRLVVFVATHPIFSKGIDVIGNIGADYYIICNSLSPKGLEKRRNVRIADLAPSTARTCGLV